MAAKKEKEQSINILEIENGKLDVCVIGRSPLILNRVSEKGWRELLLPRGKKTAADKAANLKHNPIEEFRASPYILLDDDEPTLLALLATSFKGAMRTAAMDLPGNASKAAIGRLCYVEGEYVGIYGVPQIFCSITRSADIKKTPDVRTRAIIPHWCASFVVSYVQPVLNGTGVANLVAGGGVVAGVGDWRVEKGSGSFGRFAVVGPGDAEFRHITKTGGREVQRAAMEAPEPYDRETREMLEWFDSEIERRGKERHVEPVQKPVVPSKRRRGNGSDESVLGRHP